MKKKLGFTLAEVLITLGVIGVIASVTLPALRSDVSKQSIEKQVLKFYSQLHNAFDLYKADIGFDTITGQEFDADEFVTKYLNISQKCADGADCYAPEYFNLDMSESFEPSNWTGDFYTTYVMADGSVFSMQKEEGDSPLAVYFDVNGKKGPNKIGYDLQYFSVYYDGSIDEAGATPEVRKKYSGEYLDKIIENHFNACKTTVYGGCFGHLKRNNFKFDY